MTLSTGLAEHQYDPTANMIVDGRRGAQTDQTQALRATIAHAPEDDTREFVQSPPNVKSVKKPPLI
jgi:hypothetical protein